MIPISSSECKSNRALSSSSLHRSIDTCHFKSISQRNHHYCRSHRMKPCIVLAGLDQVFINEIVHSLTGEKQETPNHLVDWTIDTKYYTADVHLCVLNSKMLVEESVANAIEVLILLLDPSHVCQ
jgi:hypothetical protein